MSGFVNTYRPRQLNTSMHARSKYGIQPRVMAIYRSATAGSNTPGWETAAVTWATNNLVKFVPIQITQPCVVTSLWTTTATNNGNVAMGLYTADGYKLINGADRAESASTFENFDVTDTLLLPGIYYIAVKHSVSTSTYWGLSGANGVTTQLAKAMGCAQASGAAGDLASSYTLAACSATDSVPYCGIIASPRTTIL